MEDRPTVGIPETPPQNRTLTNKAGKTIEVEILSATETRVKVRRLSDNREFNLKLETLTQEDQEFIETWKIENPDSDDSTSQNTTPPNEPSEISQKIVDYASSKMRVKIGNGECWTLLDRIFKALELNRPGSREWGQEIDWNTQEILPGDLLEIEAARFFHRATRQCQAFRHCFPTSVTSTS